MQTRSSTRRTKFPLANQSLIEQKRLVIPEVVGAICLDDTAFARSLYHGLVSESSIDIFLKKSRSYSFTQRRWKLPRNCTRLFDHDFYTPVRNIVSSILKHFWRDSVAQGTRQVVDTHATDLQHSESDPPAHNSRPSLVIKAEGPSFQLPRPKPGENLAAVGFSNIASCIDVQMEADELPVDEQLVRVAIYARYVQLFLVYIELPIALYHQADIHSPAESTIRSRSHPYWTPSTVVPLRPQRRSVHPSP